MPALEERAANGRASLRADLTPRKSATPQLQLRGPRAAVPVPQLQGTALPVADATARRPGGTGAFEQVLVRSRELTSPALAVRGWRGAPGPGPRRIKVEW